MPWEVGTVKIQAGTIANLFFGKMACVVSLDTGNPPTLPSNPGVGIARWECSKKTPRSSALGIGVLLEARVKTWMEP